MTLLPNRIRDVIKHEHRHNNVSEHTVKKNTDCLSQLCLDDLTRDMHV